MEGCGMRILGLLLSIGGVFGLIMSLSMDTTVHVGGERIGYGEYSTYIPSTRVHNIGLMQQKRNSILVSSVVLVVGVLLVGFGELQRLTKAGRPGGVEAKSVPHGEEELEIQKRREDEERRRQSIREREKRTRETQQKLAQSCYSLGRGVRLVLQGVAETPRSLYSAIFKLNTEDTQIIFWFLFIVTHLGIIALLVFLLVLAF